MRHTICLIPFGIAFTFALHPIGLAAETNATLLEAVRNNEVRAVRTQLASGADANARDDIGATALMYAAAFGSIDMVRLLLNGGADVNASSRTGATALMWATADTAKVRLLLDRGAAVNVAAKDGTTALITAARRANLEAMKLLLARGAQPNRVAAERTELLRIMFGERPEIQPIVAEAAINPRSGSAAAVAPLPTFPTLSNADAVRELLDLGVSPNPRGRFPALGSAAFEGHVESARVLLERGADPNARGQHGVTPLMMAAAATRPDPVMVRLLIDKGADIGARDMVERTALDWALLQGETPVVILLREAGAHSAAAASQPPSPLKQRVARAAVADALRLLQAGGPVLYERSKCISCHHQTLPLMAMARARAGGIPVNETDVTHPIRAITQVWDSRRENLMAARSRDGGGANELTYGLLAFAEAAVPRSVTTDVAVSNLLGTQRADGSWVFLDTRAPQADNSRIPFTAMAIRGLDTYAPPALRSQVEASVARARTFIRTAAPASTQDEAFTLLGLIWSRGSRSEISAQVKRLTTLQRPDGGWAQLPSMTSDAYATGQALYALAASGMSPRDRQVRGRRRVPASHTTRRWQLVRALPRVRFSAVLRDRIPTRH